MEPQASNQTPTLDASQLDAVLFDLDGVITKTAAVHAAAWKKLFDTYLRKRAEEFGETYQPFDIASDYRNYVDGKPRYDGVESFLTSRGISLPEGQPDDAPERQTICGLGNAKQAYFLEQLRMTGIEVSNTTVAFIRHLQAHGLKAAVISSSKNCTTVLEAAGISELFDAQVDGIESERLGLPGKPHPAIFLEAARRLGVDPSRAAVVEDAIAGVQAGRDGHFARVIGIARNDHARELLAHGADLVVHDLSELSIRLSSALHHIDDMAQSAEKKRLVIFLDYDGTLTPIVARPEDAHLSDAMRDVLAALARTYTVAIVSGRDLADVRQRVHLETLYYAGSHGFDIAGPGGFHALYGPAKSYLTDLDRAESALRERFNGLPGAQVERKHFAIAVHFRRVHEDDLDKVMAIVNTVQKTCPTLRQTSGKKVIELRPDLDWNKGTALFWLLEIMGLEHNQVLPVYIGDDLTDEDAFLALQNIGVGIMVTDGGCRHTAARYALSNTEEVRTFLLTLTSISSRSDTA